MDVMSNHSPFVSLFAISSKLISSPSQSTVDVFFSALIAFAEMAAWGIFGFSFATFLRCV